MDDRIQSPEDLKKYGVPALATIGVIEPEKHKNGKSASEGSPGGGRLDEHLIAILSPLSAVSEGFRHLCTSIESESPGQPMRSLMVTSPSPKEGKSTTASNLAISFAQGEGRVLLIDADMRRPMLHTLFALQKEPGLTDVLLGKKAFEEVVHPRVVDNLDLLCSGTTIPNPPTMLKSLRMRKFMDWVQASYDVVLFDSPPLLAVTDAAILSRVVDSVVMVVSAGQTGLKSLERAAEILQGVGKKPAGVVLNNFNMRRAYGGYYGIYRRNYYTYGYGYTGSGYGQLNKGEHTRR